MFFSRDITTIFVTLDRINTAVFSTRGKRIKEEKSYTWTAESLPETLKDIASRGTRTVRVVFGENVSFVVSLAVAKNGRLEIMQEAQGLIPETLGNSWDFRTRNHPAEATQVAVVKQNFFDMFSNALDSAGFYVQVCEPQSVALARLLPKKGFFVMVAKSGEDILLAAVKNHVVELSQVVHAQSTADAFNHFIPFVKKRFAVDPKAVFVGSDVNWQKELLHWNEIETQVFDLDPLRAVALKKDVKGKDASVLNIDIQKTSVFPKEASAKVFFAKKSEKILALAFILLLAGLTVFLWRKYF